MRISQLLADINLPPDARHVLEIAFNHALRKIGLVDRNDPVCLDLAKHMLDVHQRGVTDAVALAEITIPEVRSDERRR